MERRGVLILLGINLLLVLVAVAAGVWVVMRLFSFPPADPERHRRLAAALEANGLYGEAQAAYEGYRDAAGLSPADDANLHYHQAEMDESKLGNPRAALGHYLMAKELNPEASWAKDAEKRIVALLESMGRSLDAQNRLTQATALEAKPQAVGRIVARIGSREITLAELDQAIRGLSPDTQKELSDPQNKRQYLDQYLLEEMLYDAAMRKGLPDRPEVQEKLERLRRGMLAQMAFEEEMGRRTQISPQEAEKYLAEHGKEAKNKEAALERLRQEKEAEAPEALFQELRKIQDVKIYEDAFAK